MSGTATTRLDSLSAEAVKTMERVSRLIKTKEEFLKYITYLKNIICVLNRSIKNKYNDAIGNFARVESNLSILKYYQRTFRKKLSKLMEKRCEANLEWHEIKSAFNGRISSGIITNLGFKDPQLFLEKAFRSFAIQIRKSLKKSVLKVNTILAGLFVKPSDLETNFKFFSTKNEVIDVSVNLKDWYKNNVSSVILNRMGEFQERDSGWSLYEILYLKLNINHFSPINVGMSTYVDLPAFVKSTHSVINIKNNDQYCFLWSIMAALFPVYDESKNKCRVYSYPDFEGFLKYENINFPIELKDIPKFELLNGLGINIFTISNNKEIVPLCLTKSPFYKIIINLLMVPCENLTNEIAENNPGTSSMNLKTKTYYHFALIKNLSRLLSRQLKDSKNRKYFCERCLNHFATNESLERHLELCRDLNHCKIVLPKETHKILKFKNFTHQIPMPFVIYADIESLLVDYDLSSSSFALDNKTIKRKKHEAFSIAYYFKCDYDDSLSKFNLYTGSDCIKWFINELENLSAYVGGIISNPLPIVMNDEEKQNFYEAKQCYVCDNEFSVSDGKVRDHCHFSGKYRGAAHETCNLKLQISNTIPVVFHNFSNYDSHFLIRSLAKDIEGPLNILPVNKEKFISFTKYITKYKINLRFIDSFRFLAGSLEKLSSYLDDEQRTIVSKFFPDKTHFELVTRKGVFPYEYLDNFKRLDDQELPSKENFYNTLTEEAISDDDFNHANNVWKTFKIQNLKQYAELYLKTDVLLLSDIFENFRINCMKYYNLDALHYFTTPGLAFDAMLKLTKIELELLTDIEMINFIEKGIRGGVSQCSRRYAKSNNKYMCVDEYKSDEPISYLMYFDVVNLYGAAMTKALPFSDFQWVQIGSNEIGTILNTPDDAEFGYVLEVDLEYPKSLYEKHKDLPLCPHHLPPPVSDNDTTKLLLTLYNKKKYIIHYQNLKQAIKLGLKLEKVHRCLKFAQKPWMKSYIDFNTELRKASKNEFERNHFKLMNNAPFGKTIENVRRYRDIKLVTHYEGRYGANYYISQGNFSSITIIDEDIVLIEMKRLTINMNKPIFIGMCILDISKTFLYDFHYEYIKAKFNDNAKLLYTDTDSLIYQIFTDDIYQHIRQDIDKFDTSDYPENNIFNIPRRNKKVVGLMKDENNGCIMSEFIGLRSKMYTYKVCEIEKKKEQNINYADNHELIELLKTIKKVKGVKYAAIKNYITFQDFYKTLFEQSTFSIIQNSIIAKNHEIFSIQQEKVGLSFDDDKRIVLEDKISTVPWGYFD